MDSANSKRKSFSLVDNMNNLFFKLGQASLIFGTLSMLHGCSGQSPDNLTSGRGGTANSKLSVDITDAPIDDASEVRIEFSGVSLKPADADSITFTFESPRSIDLVTLQGTDVDSLLSDIIVPAGEYNWIRLHVNAVEGVNDSYIKLDTGAVHELTIPSGAQSGLKINDSFTLSPNESSKFTIDFDLRKSIVLSSGDYLLKPSLRLANNSLSSSITGNIDIDFSTIIKCFDAYPKGIAVYLFEGHSVNPEDMDDQGDEPFSTSLIKFNDSGDMLYTFGFIPAGDYTISLTCEADDDEPESDDDITFLASKNITLSGKQSTIANF